MTLELLLLNWFSGYGYFSVQEIALGFNRPHECHKEISKRSSTSRISSQSRLKTGNITSEMP